MGLCPQLKDCMQNFKALLFIVVLTINFNKQKYQFMAALQARGPEFNPKHPCQKPHMPFTYNSSTGDVEAGGSLQSSQLSKAQVQ